MVRHDPVVILEVLLQGTPGALQGAALLANGTLSCRVGSLVSSGAMHSTFWNGGRRVAYEGEWGQGSGTFLPRLDSTTKPSPGLGMSW